MLTKRYQNSAAQWQAFGVIRLSNHFPYKKLSPYDPVYAQLRKAAFISLFLSCPACPFKRLRIDGLVRPRSPWTNSCSRFTHGELVAMLKKKNMKKTEWHGWFLQLDSFFPMPPQCWRIWGTVSTVTLWDAVGWCFFHGLFASDSTISVAVACHLSSKMDIPPFFWNV